MYLKFHKEVLALSLLFCFQAELYLHENSIGLLFECLLVGLIHEAAGNSSTLSYPC